MKSEKQKGGAVVLEVPENFDQLPWEFETTCELCGKAFITTKDRYRKNKHNFCSHECSSIYKKASPNCECVICHKPLHRKPSYIKKTKNITCSYECCYKLKQMTMSGENNHQYGLKGRLNPSYEQGFIITHYGYRSIIAWDHPYHNSSGRVLEHRLVAEQFLLDNLNSIEINGKLYLRPEFTVHHIDFDKLNNNVENLCVLRKETHVAFHNSLNEIIRDDNGKIKQITNIINSTNKEELRDRFKIYVTKYNIYYHSMTSMNLIENDEIDIPIINDIQNKYITEESKLLSVKDVQRILDITEPKVYNIFNREDFPKFQIGHKYVIPKDKFYKYVNSKYNRNIQ